MSPTTGTSPKSTLKSTITPALCLAFMLCGRTVSTQLLGCDAVGCPTDPSTGGEGLSDCILDGVVGKAIGITNLTTTISSEPLTWTVSISNNGEQTFFSRDFYLGTPPGLNMTKITGVTGCALFFEGITSSLHFPGTTLATNVGTCSDALNPTCVTDLMSQATTELELILQAADDSTNVCTILEAALSSSAPKSCNVTQNGSWGTITIKEITGPSAPLPIELGDCHPTTGANYSVSHIENYDLTTEATSDNIFEPFLEGITPIMTLLFPSVPSATNGTGVKSTSDGSLTTPELLLSCMKVVQEQQQPPSVMGASSAMSRPFLGTAVMVAVIVSGVLGTFFC